MPQFDRALFIKLGSKGDWEDECLRDGTLRLGYRETSHQDCLDGNWSEVEAQLRTTSKDFGAATRHRKQIQQFYEAPSSVVWITFRGDRLYWANAEGPPIQLADGTKVRRTSAGWHDQDEKSDVLVNTRLSGSLLAVRGFRGTICAVPDVAYLVHKLNGTIPPHVQAARAAWDHLIEGLVPLIQGLPDREFESFADLLFRAEGWARVAQIGGTIPDIDLDLISPTTGQRIAAQVKSRADLQVYLDYDRRFTEELKSYDHFFLICHSPSRELRLAASSPTARTTLWDAEELSRRAVSAGLARWLMDRAS